MSSIPPSHPFASFLQVIREFDFLPPERIVSEEM